MKNKTKLLILVILLICSIKIISKPPIRHFKQYKITEHKTLPVDQKKLLKLKITREYEKPNTKSFDYVWSLSKKQSGKTQIVLTAIAFCESRLKYTEKNINKNGSYDSGLYQINSVHKINREKLMNPNFNYSVALKFYKQKGTRDWNSSRNCWKKLI